jgi:acetyltransferase-like isoleucine patch superfamily enzyme
MTKIAWGELGEGSEVLDPHLSIFLNPHAIRIGRHCRVDGIVKIEGGQGVIIGAHVHIASFCHLNIGGGVLVIGDHAGIASGARIITGSNTPEGESMSASSPAAMQMVKRLQVVLEPFAFVGVGAIILPGVTIGKGAVVGAGAVVTRNVEDYAIVAGNPARFIRWREVKP